MKKIVVLLGIIVSLAVPAVSSATVAGTDAWADDGGGGLPACTASLEGVRAVFASNQGLSVSWLCHNGTWIYQG